MFEGYGPVGERRTQDLSGRAVDASATFPGGTTGTGVEGLRAYIRSIARTISSTICPANCSPTRSVAACMLSDDPRSTTMRAKLAKDGYRFDSLIESIVTSPQFRNKRIR